MISRDKGGNYGQITCNTYELLEDYEKAKDILRKTKPLLDFFFSGPHGASYLVRIKTALNVLGLPGGVPRLPLLPADERIKAEAKKVLDSYELLEKWNEK